MMKDQGFSLFSFHELEKKSHRMAFFFKTFSCKTSFLKLQCSVKHQDVIPLQSGRRAAGRLHISAETKEEGKTKVDELRKRKSVGVLLLPRQTGGPRRSYRCQNTTVVPR